MTANTAVTVVRRSSLFEGAVERRNSAGRFMGHTLSYIGSAPAGDIKGVLKAKGFSGKELQRQTRMVLRGEKPMAWAIHDAEASLARSLGFVPVKTQSNKGGDVLTTRYELAPLTAEEQKKQVVASLSKEELLAQLEALNKAETEAKAVEVSATVQKQPEAPAPAKP